MLASQKKLLKNMIVLDKVITNARHDGKGIYALLLPALLSSLRSIKVEVLGCIEELLRQLSGPKKSRRWISLLFRRIPRSQKSCTYRKMDDLEEMENGQVKKTRRRGHSFAPLRASMSLQACERQLIILVRATIIEYFKRSRNGQSIKPLPYSTMDILSFFSFLYLVRYLPWLCKTKWIPSLIISDNSEFVAEVSVLWRGVQRLLQHEALYSKQIGTHPCCESLGRRLARI